MATNYIVQNIEMDGSELVLDPAKSILVCLETGEGKRKLWAKKLNDAGFIDTVLEDAEKYYVACESGDSSGQYLALRKDTGETLWFIPGKCFLQVLFEGFLFLIFVDDRGDHYLLKVDRENGNALWHHRVDEDLREYSFTKKRVKLAYASGKTESLSMENGNPA
jgi:outer membrane protein assembly factor BamB